MVLKIFLLAALHGLFLWCLSNGQACNSYGFICTTCTSLEFCTDGIPQNVTLTCPTDNYCDSTSASYCTTTLCTTQPEEYYNCTIFGRYAVTSNCSQYILCSNNTAGVLVPTLYECPNGTVFNPYTALCVLVADYTCTGDSTTTESTDVSCSYAGRYPITTDTTCQSYYYCYLNTNGTYTLTNLTCPTTTVFNKDTQKCVAPTSYTCPY